MNTKFEQDLTYLTIYGRLGETGLRPSEDHVSILGGIRVADDAQGDDPVRRMMCLYTERVLGKSLLAAEFAKQAKLQQRDLSRDLIGNLKSIIRRKRVHRSNETKAPRHSSRRRSAAAGSAWLRASGQISASSATYPMRLAKRSSIMPTLPGGVMNPATSGQISARTPASGW